MCTGLESLFFTSSDRNGGSRNRTVSTASRCKQECGREYPESSLERSALSLRECLEQAVWKIAQYSASKASETITHSSETRRSSAPFRGDERHIQSNGAATLWSRTSLDGMHQPARQRHQLQRKSDSRV